MSDLYNMSLLLMKICGPLSIGCLVLMFGFLTVINKKAPAPGQVIYLYARYHLARKKHAGIFTYLFVVSAIFFVLSVAGILVGSLFRVS